MKMQKDAYLRELINHNWYWRYEEDPIKRVEGEKNLIRIYTMAVHDDELMELFVKYKRNLYNC